MRRCSSENFRQATRLSQTLLRQAVLPGSLAHASKALRALSHNHGFTASFAPGLLHLCILCSLLLLRGRAMLQLDSWRVARTGAPEVVWGPGKSPEQIAAIMTSMAETEAVVLATRIPQEVRCTLSCTTRAFHCIWAVLACCPPQAAHCVAAPLWTPSPGSHPAAGWRLCCSPAYCGCLFSLLLLICCHPVGYPVGTKPDQRLATAAHLWPPFP